MVTRSSLRFARCSCFFVSIGMLLDLGWLRGHAVRIVAGLGLSSRRSVVSTGALGGLTGRRALMAGAAMTALGELTS